jgi:NAD(P)-dependent dehydrogenase (short-subunit alcohol dehydrogenase family)
MARTVLITGASRGIGRVTAEIFARSGDQIVVFDVDAARGEAFAAEARAEGLLVDFIATNITDTREVADSVAAAADRYGSIDILVNCAGILHLDSLAETNEKIWDRVMDINLKGAFLVSQAVLPYMVKNGGGRIINISSSAGRTGGVKTGVAYSVSKAGIIGLTKTLARIGAANNITVNAIAPGTTNTDMAKQFSSEEIDAILGQIPLGRLVEPDEIGSAVFYLASESAQMITGITLDINGGIYMG